MPTNRLARESSPYLLQHAHNPVDWYPWGEEAFAAAGELNRPIFLSVGYSTCYWCHVMERQCFENPQIAAEMNTRFINIKVDREERPDVDQVYMTALQVMARQGGWPMSMFLLPDLRPFFGGTYFPPEDMYGRPGFPKILTGIDEAYRNRRKEINDSANEILGILRKMAQPRKPAQAMRMDQEWITSVIARSVDDFDSSHGGFGGAPKFPRETLLQTLLLYLRSNQIPEIRNILRKTLDAMASGGIRDHLGGGFHRYSTDAQWLVPHFEIMLYDNAMLARIYAEAFAMWGEKRDEAVARGILDFLLREMTSPQGLFYTAQDAEVDAQEGGSYLWTRAEVVEALKDGADEKSIARFCRAHGLDDGPNFVDPHSGNGQPDKNVLFLAEPEALLDPDMAKLREKLYEVRRARKQPMLDTKILASWNGLAIAAMAFGGKVLKDDRYLKAAGRAMDELLRVHRLANGGLLRVSMDGSAKLPGLLDDYANVSAALLELDRRAEATELAGKMRTEFYDEESGGFFFTDAKSQDVIVRQKMAGDSPLPSGNAVAAGVMLELGEDEVARQTLSVFAQQLDDYGESQSALLAVAMKDIREHGPLVISPEDSPSNLAAPQDAARDVLQISTQWESSQKLIVNCRITAGFHVNAHGETAGALLSASHAVEIAYPPGIERRFSFSDAALRVYEKDFAISIKFDEPITKRLDLSLSYQACNDTMCLPMARKYFAAEPPGNS